MLWILLGVAYAQPLPKAADKAEADRLFEEGRTLLANGKHDEACAKFDESFRKDPRAVGTMLNLGLCREEAGQVASAVRLYREARDSAHDQGLTEHEEAAKGKIALLSPRVPRIAVQLPVGLGASARVLIDDIVYTRDELDLIQLDPGTHSLVVTAPAKLPYESKFKLDESEHKTITVPALAGATTVVVEQPTSKRALWGKILIAGGIVAIGGGTAGALLGRSQYWDQFPSGSRDGIAAMDGSHDCWTVIDEGRVVRQCNTRGQDATRSARTLAGIGIGTAITGIAIVAAGAALWATAPSSEPGTPVVSFDIGPGRGALVFGGAF